MDARQGGAMEQLAGQIASAKIPQSRMISPQLYRVMSASEFTLDINNPEEPKKFYVSATIPTVRTFMVLHSACKQPHSETHQQEGTTQIIRYH